MNDSAENKVELVLEKARQIIFGQSLLMESLLAALLCEGHLLVEGMPGLGKTLSIATIGKLCALDLKRIQFTPDLLPSDLIGTMVFGVKSEEFKVKFGPIFTQLLLADEINRAPAKVQSALLEAMAERQVTIGEETYKLKRPFVVLATQNPIEQEGTYQLPEAQIDRFMMKLKVDYPDFESEKKILEMSGRTESSGIEGDQILTADDIKSIREKIESIHMDDKIKNLIIKIVQATRPENTLFPKSFRGIIATGASPRASIWLYKLSKFKAFRERKDFVVPDHVLSFLPQIIGHRIALSYEAKMDSMDSQKVSLDLAKLILAETP